VIAPVERNGTLIPTGVSFFGNIRTAPAITTTRIAARSLFENSSGQAGPFVLLRSKGAPADGDLAAFALVSQLLRFRSRVQMLSARS
jgi:hypothetical protein